MNDYRWMRSRAKLLQGLIALTKRFGTKLRNAEGVVLCHAFIFQWKGNIHLVGLPPEIQLRPVPWNQGRLSYWRQTLCWEQAGPPDFTRQRSHHSIPDGNVVVCHVVICHLPPAETLRVFDVWKNAEPAAEVLIAYGGSPEHFKAIPPAVQAVFVPDKSLRTTDHARQRQQYAGVMRESVNWLEKAGSKATHVHLVEFDVIPVVQEPGQQLVRALKNEDADVAGFGLVDLTHTVHPHYLHESSSVVFMDYLNSISSREVRTRILSMLGCSSIWVRKCYEEVAGLVDCPAVYLEIAQPTLAHHLGYRVRPFPLEQAPHVTFKGDLTEKITEFSKSGAWLIHPCKSYWMQRD